MSIASLPTPQSSTTQPPIFEPPPYDPSQTPSDLDLQTDGCAISTSHPSSPDLRPLDLQNTIVEEEEDETSSEAANEPITPIDPQQPLPFHGKTTDGTITKAQSYGPYHGQPPLILNTSATPPASSGKEADTPLSVKTPRTPLAKRPTSSSTRDGSIKRAVSGFFRRSNSQSSSFAIQPLIQPDTDSMANCNGSDPMLGREHRRLSIRRMSQTTSPSSTRSNTPPSPLSPTEKAHSNTHLKVQEPSREEFFSANHKKNRSSTGFSLRDKFHRHILHDRDQKVEVPRNRATSVDLQNSTSAPGNQGEVREISRQIWGMAAESGIGLKARRMSLSLPDDFTVDVVELYNEFSDHGKVFGMRGKTVGKGATAHVRLMTRKGGSPGEIYAVKEFRGKSSTEAADDYEKKVKSEYSIAKSVHHPNIVETVRLCTHNGRWNHVMEFCEQGDLFNLVNQKYLKDAAHLVDRLCLFKQLVQGLNYLHTNGIAHRDIKLENLLITKDSKLKITDFGVSEVFSGIHPGVRAAGGQCGKEMGEIRRCGPGICGSPPYIAPEVLAKSGDYDPRPLDVWGAAIVMLCMTAGGTMWERAEEGSSPSYDELVRGWKKWTDKHSDEDADSPITESDYPHVGFFDNFIKPPALRRVLLTMLNPDPSKRATISQVVKNRWLKNVECCQVDSYDDPATTIDASRSCKKTVTKVVQHNHLPPSTHLGHKIVRLPGSTNM